jgi:hypothetical protein
MVLLAAGRIVAIGTRREVLTETPCPALRCPCTHHRRRARSADRAGRGRFRAG